MTIDAAAQCTDNCKHTGNTVWMLKQTLLSRLYKRYMGLDFATTALQSVRQTHNKKNLSGFQQACMQQIASPISQGFFARVRTLTTKMTCCEETRITPSPWRWDPASWYHCPNPWSWWIPHHYPNPWRWILHLAITWQRRIAFENTRTIALENTRVFSRFELGS